jgi:hypothetical protein
MGGWFRKEIKTVADLQGLKFRIGGIAGQVLAESRRRAAAARGGDIYPALEKGTIDAAEWVGPYDDEKLGFNKVAPVLLLSGLLGRRPDRPSRLLQSRKYNELPKHYQAIVYNAAAQRQQLDGRRATTCRTRQALKRLVAAGTQLRPFSNEILDACLKATNELWAEISAKNADFKKAIDRDAGFPQRTSICGGRSRNMPSTPYMIRSRSPRLISRGNSIRRMYKTKARLKPGLFALQEPILHGFRRHACQMTVPLATSLAKRPMFLGGNIFMKRRDFIKSRAGARTGCAVAAPAIAQSAPESNGV